MPLYNYSNIAAPTIITGAINTSVTSWSIAVASGLPAVPFKMVLEPGTSNQEVVLVGARTGTALSSITRNLDGAGTKSHASGAVIAHEIEAGDFRFPQSFASCIASTNTAATGSPARIAALTLSGASDPEWTITGGNRLVIPYDGVYKFYVGAHMTVSTVSTQVAVDLRANAGAVAAAGTRIGVAYGLITGAGLKFNGAFPTAHWTLTAGDTVEIQHYSASGTVQVPNNIGDGWLSAEKIR